MKARDPGRLLDWLILHLTPDLGAGSFKRLVDHFGGPGGALAASRQDLSRVSGLKPKAAASLIDIAGNGVRQRAVAELEKVARAGVDVITWADNSYPDLLRNIHHPPMVLYLKGCKASLQRPGLAMVGSRAATDYGRSIAGRLARSLARQGYSIISGLALGIDAEAHKGALAAGGSTIGVLGCGVDVEYPRENSKLYREISKTGALLSEYPLSTPPESFRFPARNRIISGLAHGVVVVEASKRSGSLITAHHALEQGREVFAIPGRVDSVKSAGTHLLLQQGAKLVQSIEDIIEELPPGCGADALHNGGDTTQRSGDFPSVPLSAEESLLFSLLDVYPKHIDEIARAADLAPQKVNELLLLLELKGVIKALPGKCYQRKGMAS
jgi:DNA processing protein